MIDEYKERLINSKEVSTLTGFCVESVLELSKPWGKRYDPKFPKRIPVEGCKGNGTRYLYREVITWINDQEKKSKHTNLQGVKEMNSEKEVLEMRGYVVSRFQMRLLHVTDLTNEDKDRINRVLDTYIREGIRNFKTPTSIIGILDGRFVDILNDLEKEYTHMNSTPKKAVPVHRSETVNEKTHDDEWHRVEKIVPPTYVMDTLIAQIENLERRAVDSEAKIDRLIDLNESLLKQNKDITKLTKAQEKQYSKVDSLLEHLIERMGMLGSNGGYEEMTRKLSEAIEISKSFDKANKYINKTLTTLDGIAHEFRDHNEYLITKRSDLEGAITNLDFNIKSLRNSINELNEGLAKGTTPTSTVDGELKDDEDEFVEDLLTFMEDIRSKVNKFPTILVTTLNDAITKSQQTSPHNPYMSAFDNLHRNQRHGRWTNPDPQMQFQPVVSQLQHQLMTFDGLLDKMYLRLKD